MQAAVSMRGSALEKRSVIEMPSHLKKMNITHNNVYHGLEIKDDLIAYQVANPHSNKLFTQFNIDNTKHYLNSIRYDII